MKKVFALLLCLALLVAVPAGCKKNKKTEVPKAELTKQLLIDDLSKHSGYYNLAFTEGDYVVSDLKVLEKDEKDKSATVKVSATATNACLRASFTAKMTYALSTDNRWMLQTAELSDKVYTVMGAPNKDSVLDALYNYAGAVGNMLGLQGEETISLAKVHPRAVTWDLQYDAETKTAKLIGNLDTSEVLLKGYYSLSFGESGWTFETKEKDGVRHYAMHLETYELKEASKK